jgi:hypothetical protein
MRHARRRAGRGGAAVRGPLDVVGDGDVLAGQRHTTGVGDLPGPLRQEPQTVRHHDPQRHRRLRGDPPADVFAEQTPPDPRAEIVEQPLLAGQPPVRVGVDPQVPVQVTEPGQRTGRRVDGHRMVGQRVPRSRVDEPPPPRRRRGPGRADGVGDQQQQPVAHPIPRSSNHARQDTT